MMVASDGRNWGAKMIPNTAFVRFADVMFREVRSTKTTALIRHMALPKLDLEERGGRGGGRVTCFFTKLQPRRIREPP